MRVAALASSVDDARTRAAVDVVRSLDADRAVFFGKAVDVAVRVARDEQRAADAGFLEETARWVLDGTATAPPEKRATGLARIGFAVGPDPAAASPLACASVLVELLGAHIVLATGRDATLDAVESAHVVVRDGEALLVDVGGGRAVLCPGDISHSGSGAILVVEGPVDARVRVLAWDGAPLDSRPLLLGGTKMTVQGASRAAGAK